MLSLLPVCIFSLIMAFFSGRNSTFELDKYGEQKYVYKENTKCIEKRIIKVNCPPYPIILKEGIKANNNIPIKTEFKDNNKYNRN